MAENSSDLFQPRIHVDAAGKKLPYRLLVPEKYDAAKSYPCVLFLHGAGERGNDNLAQLKIGARCFATPENRAKFPCFVIAPQCPSQRDDEPWGWTGLHPRNRPYLFSETPGEPERLTLEIIAALRREFSIDPARIYIVGLSMGAFGTWDLLAREPDLFSAAITICGGGDPATAPKFSKIPIWVFHGAKDEVVPPHLSREMVAALERAGGHPKYTEYPDVAHHSWNNAFSEPDLFPWLFSNSAR